MNKSIRKKIISSGILALCSFIALCVSVFGWFSMNHEVKSGGMYLKVLDHDMDLSYAIYKYDEEQMCGVDVTGQEDALILLPYDSVIISKNEHTSIIIKMVLTGQLENKKFTVDISCYDKNMTTDVLSNLLSVNIAYIDDDILSPNEISAKDIYSAAEQYFQEEDVMEKRVSFVKGTYEDIVNKTASKELKLSFDLFDFEIIDDSLTFYVQLDYNPALINSDISEFEFDERDKIITSDLDKVIIYGGNM